ncbi:TetR/AcrR family transcriptional regulator [bacterium]|nr:TetR/AcrR family transcriptional regulator [bacterium]
MGRAFTLQEKAVIRKKVITTAIELFGLYGLKKTSIDDIVKAAGIAKGTFYHFFESKESLFFEVFSTLEDTVQKPMLEKLAAIKPLTRSALADFLYDSISILQTQPLLKRFMSGEDFKHLWHRFTPEQIEALSKKDIEAFRPLIIKWQENGEIITENIDVIVQMIRCYYMLVLHEKEIGTQHFNLTLKLMAQAVSNRLVMND